MPSPIRTILASMRARGVRYLLMGGQACVLYGAAEFSRDTDLAVLADAENLRRLTDALDDLGASVIAVPPFAECWERRSTYALPEAGDVEVLGLEDLVRCKKTRRDKDWPMVRRLVEANYAEATAPEDAIGVTVERVVFWFRELRTPTLLREAAARAAGPAPYRALLDDAVRLRPAAALAAEGADDAAIGAALADEERREREADEAYWRPLIRELEALRHAARRRPRDAPPDA